MYSIRLTPYLLVIAITTVICNFLFRYSAKSENNFPNLQSSTTQLGEVQIADNLTPSVKFPETTFPTIRFSEITSREVRIQENEYLTIITLPVDVLFDSGKYRIRSSADKVLRQVSQVITNRYPETWLQILGHTDSVGSEDDNLKLSEYQAIAVQKWLSEKGGIEISLMTKEGYGETQPIAPNTTLNYLDYPTGRQKNRRIEIVIQKTL